MCNSTPFDAVASELVLKWCNSGTLVEREIELGYTMMVLQTVMQESGQWANGNNKSNDGSGNGDLIMERRLTYNSMDWTTCRKSKIVQG